MFWSLPPPGLVAARGEMQGEHPEAWGLPPRVSVGDPGSLGLGRPSEQFRAAGLRPGCASDTNGSAEDPLVGTHLSVLPSRSLCPWGRGLWALSAPRSLLWGSLGN